MIYIREISATKITIAIIFLAAFFIAVAFSAAGRFRNSSKRDEESIGSIALICGLASLAFLFFGTATHDKDIPLSEIDNKITIEGEKVVIDKLDKDYNYNLFLQDDKAETMSSNRHIFKFEYDALYETGKLTDQYGRYRMLDKEDIDYLRSKQSKGEK